MVVVERSGVRWGVGSGQWAWPGRVVLVVVVAAAILCSPTAVHVADDEADVRNEEGVKDGTDVERGNRDPVLCGRGEGGGWVLLGVIGWWLGVGRGLDGK